MSRKAKKEQKQRKVSESRMGFKLYPFHSVSSSNQVQGICMLYLIKPIYLVDVTII